MAVVGKTIPASDDPIVDHDAVANGFGGASNATTPATGFGGGFTAPGAPATGGFGSTTGGFGSTPTSGGFGSTTGGFGSTPTSGGFGSAPASGGFGNGSGFGTSPTGFGSQQPAPILTAPAASNAASDAEVLVKTDDKFGNFVNSKWRPMMAFIYMITCMCDFVVFPVLWSVLQAVSHGQVTSQWQPLTLQGAGLYHLAMGAVLGVAAYGRTKEKVAGAA